jgi:hypothetical protein
MGLLLLRDLLKLAGKPSPGKLLDSRDIHNAVMQVLDNRSHLAFEKDLVGVDTVTGQDAMTRGGDVGFDELEDLGACF